MKEWECIKVGYQKDVKDVAKTIEEYQKKGWRLHTYTCAQAGVGDAINHCLLFEKGE